MNLLSGLKWMFFGSLFIGIFLNAMNILAFRLSDLYLSKTLVYSALLMASNMCILEIMMHYSHTQQMRIQLAIFFILLSTMTIIFLREQVWVNDNEWLKRMISHHSTALTTSHKIKNKTKNEKVKKLATEIIETQEREIKLMKELLQ